MSSILPKRRGGEGAKSCYREIYLTMLDIFCTIFPIFLARFVPLFPHLLDIALLVLKGGFPNCPYYEPSFTALRGIS